MFAAISRSDLDDEAAPESLQRADGQLRLAFRRSGGQTRLASHYERGAAKARLPRRAGLPPEVVLINTAGGLTGGDRMDYAIDVGPGAAVALTTQACEKIYRAAAGESRVETRLALAPAAEVEWLPQETILFDGARLVRRLSVDMAADAALLAVEAIVFGRTASGERVMRGALRDSWRLRRDGRLLFADGVRLDGDMAATLSRPAAGAGAGAVATVVRAAPDIEACLEAARAALSAAPAEAGVSAWNGLLVGRLVAKDGACLRAALRALLSALRDSRRLPRVWDC
jgi:urease accessory protein